MANYAVIRNGVIDNVIVAETLEIAETVTNTICVELSEGGFGIGDLWDGTQFVKQQIIDVEEVTPTPELN
jgi:hypothetical protein